MLKTIAQFEHVVEGKVGRFLLDHDTSVSAAKEMCFAFLKYIGQIEDAAKAQQEASKSPEEEQKPEDPKEVS